MSINVKVNVDDSDLDRAEARSAQVTARIDRNVRKALTYTTLSLQAIGVAIDEAFRIQAEFIALSMTTLASILATGLSVGNIARVGQLIILQLQLQALRQGRSQAATQLGAAEQLIDYAFIT